MSAPTPARHETTHRPRPPDPSPLGMVAVMAAVPAALFAASYPLVPAALAAVGLAALAAHRLTERRRAADGRSRRHSVCVPGTAVCLSV